MERTPNKSQHTKLTLEKKILPSLLPGHELATFRSRVRRSTNKLSRLLGSIVVSIPACHARDRGPFPAVELLSSGPLHGGEPAATAQQTAPSRPGPCGLRTRSLTYVTQRIDTKLVCGVQLSYSLTKQHDSIDRTLVFCAQTGQQF